MASEISQGEGLVPVAETQNPITCDGTTGRRETPSAELAGRSYADDDICLLNSRRAS
jgi:hypothetical protein